MSLIETLIEKAKQNPKRVALPECEADKTLLAARKVLDEGIGTPVLVNDPAVIRETAARVGVSLDGMEIVDTPDEGAAGAAPAAGAAEAGAAPNGVTFGGNPPLSSGVIGVITGSSLMPDSSLSSQLC